MQKIQLIVNSLFLTLCIFISPKVSSEPYNLSLLTNEVVKYHDSGEYEQELSQQISKVREFMFESVKKHQKSNSKEKLALVLDIDETSITNYHNMIKRKFTFTKEQFNKEVNEASSPAIKPTLELYKEAQKLGVAVFFVTGRHEHEREATVKNLNFAGFNNWDGLYLKSKSYNEKSAVPFKAKTRAKIMQDGYRIIATIGDQFSDLEGGYADRGFKLPNPYYYLP